MPASSPAELVDAGPHLAVAGVALADTLTPADRYHELFIAVQMNRVFTDGKTFVDAVPRRDPREILDAYRVQCHRDGFDLRAFVTEHFQADDKSGESYVSDPEQSLMQHIDALWDVLKREPQEHPPQSSLLPLPYPYVVPGGRFIEIYYWDSYFTMLGLAASGRGDLVRGMVDNFAYLIDTYGHVPNGNRTYYLSRSQPPMFVFMVELLSGLEPDCLQRYLPVLRREYSYWMEGEFELRPGEDHRQLVRLAGGALLNRYWDDRDTPREESYLEDVTTAAESDRKSHDVYRDLRAAAASGWDFSSRWLDEPDRLHTIRTTSILPVDLNCFLHRLESMIAALAGSSGDKATASEFATRADARRDAILRLMWDAQQNAFFDYDWVRDQLRTMLTAATVAPLFVGIARPAQAAALAATVREHLLAEGGLSTTQVQSGQQWDWPNGWAPLQWLAIEGFKRCGQNDLAHEIAQRWLGVVSQLYRSRSKLVEKYTIHEDHPRGSGSGGEGGEYPLQDGFGWTNGVTRRLLQDYPLHEAATSKAGEG